MPNVLSLLENVRRGELDNTFEKLYCADSKEILAQRVRYSACLQAYADLFGKNKDVHIFSTPARTEISGNHTDHNCGIALGAAVTTDIIAVVGKNDDNLLRVRSRGYDKTIITELSDLTVKERETGRSPALVRGVAAAVKGMGGALGGMDIYTSSNIIKGSGLSSSAAFEVIIATAINRIYNQNRFTPLETARIGSFAENAYYGKRCGILDQIVCAEGGILYVDMKNTEQPHIEKIKFDFDLHNFDICVVDTRLSHGNQQKEHSEIYYDMKKVAELCGKSLLGELPEKDFYAKLPEIKQAAGDRALLRAIHFYGECKRTRLIKRALTADRFDTFLELVTAGGHSSFEYNQNAFSLQKPEIQPVPLALAISQRVLEKNGAWRLQGSGFAGTVQAFVPKDMYQKYTKAIERIFGKNSCIKLKIRKNGPVMVV